MATDLPNTADFVDHLTEYDISLINVLSCLAFLKERPPGDLNLIWTMGPDPSKLSFRVTITLQNEDGPGLQCLMQIDHDFPTGDSSYPNAIRGLATRLDQLSSILEKMVEERIKAKVDFKPKYRIEGGIVVEN